MSRYISEARKKLIAARQKFRCANEPGSNLKGLENYKCLLWKETGKDQGIFDDSLYEIDHIKEFSRNGNNEDDNLQALCNSCHAYKTRKYMMQTNKKIKNDFDDDQGNESIDESDSETEDETNDKSEDKSDKNCQTGRQYINVNGVMMLCYICDRCKKIFNKKTPYDEHMNRIFSCKKNSIVKPIKEFNCNICNKHFNRSDMLKRHEKSQSHIDASKTQITGKRNINLHGDKNKNIGNITDNSINNSNNNNNNNNNNNYYFISPFGHEEISGLTTAEKLSTLLSPQNPLIQIVLATNLDPNKQEYHNVGYPDIKSGYGIIFNGNTWEKKEITTILNELMASKKNDLHKINIEVSPFLSETDSREIKEKLHRVENNVEPKTEYHVKSKNDLRINLKTHFYNGRALVQEAKKITGAATNELNNNNNNNNNNQNTQPWLDKYDVDDIDKKIKLKKLETEKFNIKKELALYTLDKTNINNETLKNIINETTDIEIINIINRLLIKSFCLNENLDENIIKKQIKKDAIMNKFLRDV